MTNWNEADHPRVPQGSIDGGQFTNDEVAAATWAARQAAGADTLHTNMLAKAREMADLGFERIYQFNYATGEIKPFKDAETGEVFDCLDGDEHSVSAKDSMIGSMWGNSTLHNHPSGTPTFSRADIRCAQARNEPTMSIVAGDWLVTAHRPPRGWSLMDRELQFKFDMREMAALTIDNAFEQVMAPTGRLRLREAGAMMLEAAYKSAGIQVTYERIR